MHKLILLCISSLLLFDCTNGLQSVSITFEEFSKSFTNNKFHAPEHKHYDGFMQSLPVAKITDKTEAAMFLANLLHESAGLRYVREICTVPNCANKENYKNAKLDKPGQYYYGRGYIQLTGSANYKEASLYLFNDTRLLDNPDLVAQNESLSWAVSAFYWAHNVHPRTGTKMHNFADTHFAINSHECKKEVNQKDYHHNGRYEVFLKTMAAFGLAAPLAQYACKNYHDYRMEVYFRVYNLFNGGGALAFKQALARMCNKNEHLLATLSHEWDVWFLFHAKLSSFMLANDNNATYSQAILRQAVELANYHERQIDLCYSSAQGASCQECVQHNLDCYYSEPDKYKPYLYTQILSPIIWHVFNYIPKRVAACKLMEIRKE